MSSADATVLAPAGAADARRAAVQRRTMRVLVAAQLLSGAGLAAGVTVGALLAQDMLGTVTLAGLPSALFTAGAAAAALGVGVVSQRAGRRPGLALGYLTGAVGGAGVVAAAAWDHVPLLLLSLVVYGAGTATNLQARYAGADLAAPERRGRAVSTVLVATTLGAVAGPNLVPLTGDVVATWGVPRLAGPFALAALAYAAAGVVLAVLLRPDPLLEARAAAAEATPTAAPAARGVRLSAHARGQVLLAGAVMVVTQAVMVAIMTMTPVHMRDHGHSLAAAGAVIAVHVGAMYLPSPLAGWLVDRIGTRRVAAAAGVTLLAAGLVAALAPARSAAVLAVALALLGLGWSLGLVSGTAMLTAALPLEVRAALQGRVDLVIAVAGAGAGMTSGLVVGAADYATLALAGAGAAVLLLPVVVLAGRRPA